MRKLLIFFATILISLNLQAKTQLTACAENWPPYDYLEMGQPTGIDTRINQALFKQLNVKPKIIIVPWKVCVGMLKSGKADMGFMVAHAEERKQFIRYANLPILKANYVFFINKKIEEKHDIKNCKDLRKASLKIGLVSNNAYGEKLWNCIGKDINTHETKSDSTNIITDNTLEASMKALSWGGVEAIPAIQAIGDYTKEKLNLKDINHYSWTIFSRNFYTVFSKKSKFSNKQYSNIKTFQKAYEKALGAFKKSSEFKNVSNIAN